MYVLVEDQGELVLRRAGIRQLVRARIESARLDRELADGRAPVTDALLAVRAMRLYEPAYQRALGRNLAVLSRVRGCLPDSVTVLAGLLSDQGPATIRVVALANCLLSDGTGPLYRPGRERALDSEITRVLAETARSPEGRR